MDKNGPVEVSPEDFARHTSSRIVSLLHANPVTLIDGCGGLGGNAIAFALDRNFSKIMFVEVDKDRINMARNNSEIYGIPLGRIEYFHEDFLEFPKKKAITLPPPENLIVFLSPPWGGKAEDYESINYPVFEKKLIVDMFIKSSEISDFVVVYLPKNISFTDIAKLGKIANFKYALVEGFFRPPVIDSSRMKNRKRQLNDKEFLLKAVTVYYMRSESFRETFPNIFTEKSLASEIARSEFLRFFRKRLSPEKLFNSKREFQDLQNRSKII